MKLARRGLRALLVVACVGMQFAHLPWVAPRTANATGPWFVSAGGSNGIMCGLTSVTPCQTIAYVMNLRPGFVAGDTINLATGTLSENLVLTRSVTIVGGGIEASVINGNTNRVISVTAGVRVNLNALTLTKGGGTADGGAVWNAGVLRLDAVGVSDSLVNQPNRGGGIFNAGVLTATNSVISGSIADLGAGLYNSLGANAWLSNTTVASNRALSNGGGIFNAGVLTITRSSILANQAERLNQNSSGGGLDTRGPVLVLDSVVADNEANYGGGINSQDGGRVTLLRTVVRNNAAGEGGGLANYIDGAVSADQSAIVNNSASNIGGGISNNNFLVMTNTTVSGNKSAGGFAAGIDSYSASGPANVLVSLTNVTLMSNMPIGSGSAVGIRSGVLSRVHMTNTVIAQNGNDNCLPADGGTFQSFGYNLSDATDCEPLAQPTDRTNIAPGLGALLADGSTYFHPVLAISAVLDAIPPGACPTRDQRGVSRPQGALCDIGAIESVPVDLSMAATATPASVLLSNPFAFVAEVTNGGANAATGVGVTGALPVSATVVGCAATQGTCTSSAGQLGASLGTLAAGAKATVTLQLAPLAIGPIGMTLTTSANEPDNNAANNAQPVQISIQSSADLSLESSGPGDVPAGTEFTLALQMANLGSGAALAAVVNITVPTGVTYVAAPAAWSCGQTASMVTCALAPALLPPGPAPSLLLVLRAPASGSGTRLVLPLDAVVTASSTDPNLANNQAAATLMVNLGTQAYLPLITQPQR